MLIFSYYLYWLAFTVRGPKFLTKLTESDGLNLVKSLNQEKSNLLMKYNFLMILGTNIHPLGPLEQCHYFSQISNE